jgi:hypothetical protein
VRNVAPGKIHTKEVDAASDELPCRSIVQPRHRTPCDSALRSEPIAIVLPFEKAGVSVAANYRRQKQK